MKTRITTSLLALAFLLALFAGTALAHFVTPTCGSITFNDTNAGWTAVLQPGDKVFGPFAHDGDNGPYKVDAGTYTYQYVDDHGKNQESGSITVPPCATPTPSTTATPHPSPSNSHATPRPTPPRTDETSSNTTTNNDAIIASDIWFVVLMGGVLIALVIVSLAYFDRPRGR